MNIQEDEQGKILQDEKVRTAPHFKVVLFNDEDHTYDYVVELLTKSCVMAREQAFRCAVEVDLTGRTIIYLGSEKSCENVVAKVTAFGPDFRLLHSMTSMQAAVEGR